MQILYYNFVKYVKLQIIWKRAPASMSKYYWGQPFEKAESKIFIEIKYPVILL